MSHLTKEQPEQIFTVIITTWDYDCVADSMNSTIYRVRATSGQQAIDRAEAEELKDLIEEGLDPEKQPKTLNEVYSKGEYQSQVFQEKHIQNLKALGESEFQIAIPVEEIGGFELVQDFNTAQEILQFLRHRGLTKKEIKGIKTLKSEFVECDSGNISHASAYYLIKVMGPLEIIKKLDKAKE